MTDPTPSPTPKGEILKLAEEIMPGAVIAMAGNEHPERAASVVDECADVFIVLSVLVGRYFPFTPLMEAVKTKLVALAALAPDTEPERTPDQIMVHDHTGEWHDLGCPYLTEYGQVSPRVCTCPAIVGVAPDTEGEGT